MKHQMKYTPGMTSFRNRAEQLHNVHGPSATFSHRMMYVGMCLFVVGWGLVAMFPPNYSPNTGAITQAHAAVFGDLTEDLLGPKDHIEKAHIAITVGATGKVTFTENLLVNINLDEAQKRNHITRWLPRYISQVPGKVLEPKYSVEHVVIHYRQVRSPAKFHLESRENGVYLHVGGLAEIDKLTAPQAQQVSHQEIENGPDLPAGVMDVTLQYTVEGLDFDGGTTEAFYWTLWKAENYINGLFPRQVKGDVNLPTFIQSKSVQATAKSGGSRDNLRGDVSTSLTTREGVIQVRFEKPTAIDPGEQIAIQITWPKGTLAPFLPKNIPTVHPEGYQESYETE